MKNLKIVFLGILAAFLLWATGFGYFMFVALTMEPEKPEHVDAIIVLTGDVNRIEKGLEIFSQNISGHLFITGIHPLVTQEDILKRSAYKLPQCCISYDLAATTTVENGVETKRWAEAQKEEIKTILLVTSDYHMRRGAQEIQFALPDITLYRYPVPSTEKWYKQSRIRLFLLEYHKFLYRAVIMTIEG